MFGDPGSEGFDMSKSYLALSTEDYLSSPLVLNATAHWGSVGTPILVLLSSHT